MNTFYIKSLIIYNHCLHKLISFVYKIINFEYKIINFVYKIMICISLCYGARGVCTTAAAIRIRSSCRGVCATAASAYIVRRALHTYVCARGSSLEVLSKNINKSLILYIKSLFVYIKSLFCVYKIMILWSSLCYGARGGFPTAAVRIHCAPFLAYVCSCGSSLEVLTKNIKKSLILYIKSLFVYIKSLFCVYKIMILIP